MHKHWVKTCGRIYIILLFISLCASNSVWGQDRSQSTAISVSGQVFDKEHNAIENALVIIRGSKQSTTTDQQGFYTLKCKSGQQTLQISLTGYKPIKRTIHLKSGNNEQAPIYLEAHEQTKIAEVVVEGKSAIKNVKESPFNVAVLDAKKFHNSPVELTDVLNRASGIKVRQNGGLGSRSSISLNGFSGRHVKIFIDGVPVEGMGSAFQLNNIPINLAERIEIYNGVVPIELGADALGGAINIISNKNNKSYAEVSYAYGSFNTHKTNINLGHTTRSGFTILLNAFQNYSDNNYPVYTQVRDFETSIISKDSVWTKAFHNNYHNETAVLKTGFVNKKWADQFLVGITLGKDYSDIQNSNIMKIVYGEKSRKGTTVMPSLIYTKKNLLTTGFDITLTGNYNRNYNQNTDTATREYNWYGHFVQKKTVGEGVNSMAEFYNNNANSSLNLIYKINEQHSFALNDNWSTYRRKNADKNIIKDQFTLPKDNSSNYKNVVGVSYKYNYNKKWVSTVFGKHFIQSTTGMVNVGESESFPTYKRMTAKSDAFGYGLASSYLQNDFQYKFSVEKALRMPSAMELMGDAVLERANASLRPEVSENFNLGVSYQKDFAKNHAVYFDASGLYRNVTDFIQRQIVPRTGEASSVNHGRVRNIGVNFEGRYYYKRFFSAGGTLTYQSLINKEKYDKYENAQLSQTYNDRMPNQPYFYANGEAEIRIPHLGGKANLFTLGYHLQYVHSFFLRWPSLGESGEKSSIEKTLSHDIIASYAMKSGRYNISLEGRNITDQRLYDNYSLQKPGRSFNVKLRYFIM
ncbi:TonB-dependent receptor [Sphingobacterium sp. BN32]|uniref:TonB-dependent receptor n=1 Tax=Sphingobacterium sp. BN32 TaxID=3058432 RepID=UPI00265C987C|nr:TonB-dependent receptor [Sphingobacterium sp. BN32]WKK59553.1 TonB-dependent receptor [Sphingobacterium sp. BN32]